MKKDEFATVQGWLEEISFRTKQTNFRFGLSIDHFDVVGTFKEARRIRRLLQRLRRLYWSKTAQFFGVNSEITDHLFFQALGKIEIKASRHGLARTSKDSNNERVEGISLSEQSNGKSKLSLSWTKTNNEKNHYLECSTPIVSTTLSDGQGLGNQLWAIAVTRVIAQKRGLPFSILGAQHFKGSGIFNIDFGDFVPLHVGENLCETCSQRKLREDLSIEKKMNRNTLWGLDPRILDGSQAIHISGNFQSTNYLYGFEADLREWLKPVSDIHLANEVVVIHYRAGDFRGNPHSLPASYFQKAIEICLKENSETKFLILSDQIKLAKRELDLPARYFYSDEIPFYESQEAPIAPHHFGSNLARDFNLMVSAKRLIIPNSSLSWWAAFISLPEKKDVFAPKLWDNYGNENQQWKPPGLKEAKFRFLD
jgi:hypothetical protein